MKEISIVTAFFKINRAEWKGFNRSDELYFEYFKAWAKVKNKIIAYVETEELQKKIIEFRSSLGLEDMTIVKLINNCTSLDPELYNSIDGATRSKVQQDYRFYPSNPEVWNPTYNYVMLMKMWCVNDAVQNKLVNGMVAWVDFGYNHGGMHLSAESDFNFKWEYDFPDKINVFTIQDLDNRPIFDIVFSMDTYIMGMIIVGIDYLWEKFWHLMRESMLELNHCGLTDDDQNVILMCVRKCPEIFCCHKSEWQIQMKQFGGGHLKVVDVHEDSSFIKLLKHIWHKCNKIVYCTKLCYRIFKHMYKNEIH